MKYLAIFVAFLIILACGGGGGGTGSIANPNEMPIATRSAAIAKVETKAEQLYGQVLTPAQRCTQVAAYMKTLPEFSDAGTTTEETAWGKFTDGRMLVVVNNRMPEWYSGRPGGASYQPTPRPLAAGKVSKSTSARLFHSFGTGFFQQQSIISRMGGWLTNAGFTLTPSADGDARLSVLRGVSGDGFFYFNTHGGSFNLTATDKIFCLASSTLRNDGNERQAEIAADLNSFRAVYMTAPNGLQNPDGTPATDTRYAITNLFVDQYWSFGENSVVFINACWSAYTAETGGAGPFIQSCKNKGAGVYLGWTNLAKSPSSENVPLYFVDRLTAANSHQKETPDQRPFFVSEILADMRKKNLIPAQGADLVASYKSSNVGIRPTIEFVQMYEAADFLTIRGSFGDQRGEVFVEGTPALSIPSWTNDQIGCVIPKKGAGSFGDVMVKVHGKESNKRQLTKWSSSFSFTQTGQGTLKCTITASVHMRQDLAPRRSKPGEMIKLVDPIPMHATTDSTCSFNSTGEYRDSEGKLIEKWTGSGALAWSSTPVNTPSAKWIANGAYDPVTGEFAVGLIAGGPKVITSSASTTTLAGGGACLKILNTVNWTVPAQNETGNPRFSFTSWTPQSPPKSTLQYRPGQG